MRRPDDEIAKTIRERLDDVQKGFTDIMADVEAYYRITDNDEPIKREIDVIARAAGRSSKDGHILLIVGESHTGKSMLINHWLDENEALRPIEIDNGNFAYPIFRCKAPSKGDVTAMGREMAFRLGYRNQRQLNKDLVFQRVRAQLQLRGIKLVFIDDFQNLVSGHKAKEIAQELKLLLQDEDWPVHIMIAGLPNSELITLEDPTMEMEARIRLRHLKELNFRQHHKKIRKMILEVLQIAGLETSMPLHEEFLARLIHGARNRLGLIFKMLHFAIEDALDSGERAIGSDHWERAYMELAKRGRNVFTDPKWRTILRGVKADGTLTDEDEEDQYKAPEEAKTV
ncbi:ATP-binding protein [Rhizobium sp. 21-4511-3d]